MRVPLSLHPCMPGPDQRRNLCVGSAGKRVGSILTRFKTESSESLIGFIAFAKND